MHRTVSLVLAGVLVCVSSTVASAQQGGKPELTAEQWQQVDALLGEMTLREKAGQMVQLTLGAISSQLKNATDEHVLDVDKARAMVAESGIGSILNAADVAMPPEQWREIVTTLQEIAVEESAHGIPLIYGVDSVHGANYILGATIFPQNLTLAATWNTDLAHAMGRVTADETRAVGIPWNFAPVADVKRHPAWSRVFETLGEDPYLAGELAVAQIRGMQEPDGPDSLVLAATAKHFVGYSEPRTGRDRTPASIAHQDLEDIFVLPFRMAVDAGVRSIMVNSGEVNGVPVHANPVLLTDLLRDDLGFEGVVVTDWEDIGKLVNFHGAAADEREATRLAVEAGIDITMAPFSVSFIDHVVDLVESGELSESRIDASARRIIALKFELGLFESPLPPAGEIERIGSPEAALASLETARQGIVLLENGEGTLPLASDGPILIAGPMADRLAPLHGSWTYSWQGTDEALYPKTPTILDAMRERFGADRISTDQADAGGASAIVLCIGEDPSTEQIGDITDLTLDDAQLELVRSFEDASAPVILVLVTNRPRVITPIADIADAVLWLGQPGPYGPEALAEIVAGDVNPSGHLPFSYPQFVNALVLYNHKPSEVSEVGGSPAGKYNPLYAFGHGLSYTTFEHSGLEAVRSGDTVRVSVEVSNTGSVDGDDVVQVYVSDPPNPVTPRVKRLVGFDRVSLAGGSSERVTVEIPLDRFQRADATGINTLYTGTYIIRVGELESAIELE
ncbi:MAG: glycoside hydrolase family 3 N-terminal domain-containing protein [Planctomycetota bacterium]